MADIEEIKKRLDIVQIISEHITLKKAGVVYKAVCPFHSEKTPSFTVSPERGTWRCFGCSEGGDVISFVQKIDNLEFREALERLASRVGIELEPMSAKDQQTKSDRVKILEILEYATKLYHELLLKHPAAEAARQYIKKRGLSEEVAQQFRLGFAPDAWHTVEHMLDKKKIDAAWGTKSGISIEKGSNAYYDRFRNRLMFPIDDAAGRIIGFTGRILIEDKNQPKYVNTSESPAFKKSESLYALSFARAAIREKHAAVMMEGQMDCITAHQFGFTNTVATSGTALTSDHLRIIKRYTDTVIFAFDNDSAGIKAARGAAESAYALELNALFISIPYGKDPDECIRHDKSLWEKAITDAQSAVDFFLDQELSGEASLTALRKKAVTQSLLPLVALVKNAVEQAEYIRRLSSRLSIPERSLLSDMHHLKTGSTRAPEENTEVVAEPISNLERQAVGLCVGYYKLLPPLPVIRFENGALQTIYDMIKQAKVLNQPLESVLATLPKTHQSRLHTLELETLRRHEQLEEASIQIEIIDILERLATRDREARIATHASAIAAAFASGDKNKARQLLKSLDSDTIKSTNAHESS